MDFKTYRSFACLLVVALLAQLASCEKPPAMKKPALYPVQGKVLIDGEPPIGALIKFIKQDSQKTSQRPSSATVQQDGSFKASTFSEGDGMPPGQYNASLFWLEMPESGGMMVDRLHGMFMDPSKPIFTFEVLNEAKDLGEIPLRTKP